MRPAAPRQPRAHGSPPTPGTFAPSPGRDGCHRAREAPAKRSRTAEPGEARADAPTLAEMDPGEGRGVAAQPTVRDLVHALRSTLRLAEEQRQASASVVEDLTGKLEAARSELLEKGAELIRRAPHDDADDKARAERYAVCREGFSDGACLWMREDLIAGDPDLFARAQENSQSRALPLYIPVGTATVPDVPEERRADGGAPLGTARNVVVGTPVGPPRLRPGPPHSLA